MLMHCVPHIICPSGHLRIHRRRSAHDRDDDKSSEDSDAGPRDEQDSDQSDHSQEAKRVVRITERARQVR
jgi:hypothetical protein